MIENSHERVMSIFLEACERPTEEREAYLDEACGDDTQTRALVVSLLAHDQRETARLEPDAVERLLIAAMAERDATPQAERIGPYHLTRKLGEGGMGEVWEAQQEQPIRRTVALKLIKPGMDTSHVVTRFESERQALALMQHPNVARVLDAGATEQGRPYFVMEYVPGTPITSFCDEQSLDNRERLELFAQVCDGIQHAHQKGIIHRDIKPSNVLVEKQNGTARPVVIDFGVAKAVGARLTERTLETQLGALVGTPEYMSPEQADSSNADIDTRTDVYSLGVLLYELLVGERPFDSTRVREAGLIELLRMIQQEEPSKPSTRISTLGGKAGKSARRRRADPRSLARELRGDLDWITMKALSKDRAQRYGSPAELAADLRRHANHEPVEAGPPSVPYRVRKFVRRHALGVGVVVLGFALVLGIAVRERIQAGVIAVERDRASQEARTAEQVAGFMTGLFEVSDPSEARGNTITAREILDEGAERIEQELSDDPLIQARMMRTMGAVYRNLGLYEPAREMLKRALEVHEEYLGPENLEVANDMEELARVHFGEWNYKPFRELVNRVLEIREKHLPSDHRDVARAKSDVAGACLQFARLFEAERLLEEALAVQESFLEPGDLDLAATVWRKGILHKSRGEREQALSVFRNLLAIHEEHLGANHPKVSQVYHDIFRELFELWRFGEAELVARRNLEIRAELYVDRGVPLIESYFDLGRVERALGNFEEARLSLGKALETCLRTIDQVSWDEFFVRQELARVYMALNELDAAKEQLQQVASAYAELMTRRGMSGELDPSLEWDFVYLKWLYGEREAAAVRFEELLSQMREAWGEADTDYNYYAAKFHSLAGNKNLAIQHLRRAIDRGFESPEMAVDPELDPLRGDPELEALAERARTLAATPDYWELAVRRFGNEGPSEAGKYFALAFEWMEREWGQGSPETLFRRAEFHALMGQRDEALVTLRQAAESGFADERVHLDPELDSLRGDPEFDLLANEILPVDQVIGLQTTEDEP